jgi:hypothetical protein
MSEYAQRFAEARIEIDVLPELILVSAISLRLTEGNRRNAS